MSLIQNISSTLKTWVFKKKLLKFSDRFARDPQACFYCPEMCRFACPVTEALRDDTVTPRGKMSLLHLAERGFTVEKVTGTAEARQWYLEQCTGCGRCTEYCVHEVDVGLNLRDERRKYFEGKQIAEKAVPAELTSLLSELGALSGIVLIAEPGRKSWWEKRPGLLVDMGVTKVSEVKLPAAEWSWGKLERVSVEAIGESLKNCRQIWVESPEVAWFLAQGVKEEREKLRAEVRVVWQRGFGAFAARELPVGTVFHESYHLSRLLPRLGYSIPMYERGLLPFHSGWNVIDCGGEGFYREAHGATSELLGKRMLEDLGKDGRRVSKIICQSLSCVEHLRKLAPDIEITYWLDEESK